VLPPFAIEYVVAAVAIITELVAHVADAFARVVEEIGNLFGHYTYN